MKYKHLKIENFKGIKSFETDLGNRTTITGDNGAGKTTILDAISWVLHGKNMDNKKDSGIGSFNIKPLNPDGSKENLVTKIALTIGLESGDVLLERSLNGSKTEVKIDESPLLLKEYERWIEDNIIEPDRFRLFSDPLYFPDLPWKDQRDIFMKFFVEPSSDDVLATISDGLHSYVHEKLKTMTAEKIIESAHKNTVEFEDKVKGIQSKIDLLNEQLANTVKTDDYEKLRARREELDKEIEEIRENNQKHYDGLNAVRDAESKVSTCKRKLQARMDEITFAREKYIRDIEEDLDVTNKKAVALNAEIEQLKSSPVDTICPACGQDLPKDKVDTANANIEEMISTRQKKIDELANYYTVRNIDLENARKSEPDFEGDEECVRLRNEINEAQAVLDVNHTWPELKDAGQLRTERDKITETIGAQDRIEDDKKRLESYGKELKTMSRELEESQRIEKDAGIYVRARAEFLLKSVESEFDTISVILYKPLENGKTRDCFEISRDGVPYSDLNRTGKLAAGLEFLKYFRKQEASNGIFNIPVIIDNFESYPSLDLSLLEGVQTIVTKVVKGQKEIKCQIAQ